jgi:hypothetical protein
MVVLEPTPATAPLGSDSGVPGGEDGAYVIDRSWDAAVALLHGSQANHFLCCGSLVLSATFTVVGFVMMTEGHRIARNLMIVSMIFLLSQAFSVAKLSRDRYMAKMATSDPTVPKSWHVFLPTKAYIVQVLVFTAASLFSAVLSMMQIQVNPSWYGFGFLALIWLLVASLCLSKSARDRRDANAWASATATHLKQLQMKHVLNVCAGSLEYRVLVWVAFISAICFFMVFTWAGWIELALERRGFLSICVLFHANSCFHMAKLVRDRGDPVKSAELQKQLPFQAMVIASFVISLMVPLVSICMMNLEAEKTLFLLVGQLMTTNTTLNVAKTVRDKQEMQKLHEQLSYGGFIV